MNPVTETRWKIACCNWSHPRAPHALAYLLVDGQIQGERWFSTWAEAVEYVSLRVALRREKRPLGWLFNKGVRADG